MRLIDADDLTQKFYRLTEVFCTELIHIDTIVHYIENMPTADVRENVRAYWIDMKPTGDSRFMCSRCRWKENVPTVMGEPIIWNYCPSCGADMRGANHDRQD